VPDPDEARGEELGWQSAGQLGAGLCLGREKAWASKVFDKFLIIESTEISSKNLLGNTIGAPKLAQQGKDQCLPSAVRGGRGAQKVTPRPKLPRCLPSWLTGTYLPSCLGEEVAGPDPEGDPPLLIGLCA
jgi:hypothetical protein